MLAQLSLSILSLQVGMPKTISPENGREWTTGFFKESVPGPLKVSTTGLEGDGQADLRVHGGPEKAINVYPSEHYPGWRERLGMEDLPHGAFGENFTTMGAVETEVCIGDIFESNGAHPVSLQISQPRQPCWKLSRRWNVKDLAAQVERNGFTGWYFRALRGGEIESGTSLHLTSRPHPEWTIERANQIMHHHKDDLALARSLADCPHLSSSWQESLSRRVNGKNQDQAPRLEGPVA